MQNQEPHAEHHVANLLVVVLILRSICGPLKRKLVAFSCHILLSSVPPPCVMLWRSLEMNFTRHPRVTKLFCIDSPLNRSQGRTYCKTLLLPFSPQLSDQDLAGCRCSMSTAVLISADPRNIILLQQL